MTWQEAEAKHLKDGEEYRLRKYNEVKSMHDGFQESKRKSVEDTAIKNKMIYEQEREHVRRELGSEPYAFGGADGHSYPGYTGYGARAGGALGYSCHPNKPVQGHGYSADGKQSLETGASPPIRIVVANWAPHRFGTSLSSSCRIGGCWLLR